MRIIALTTCHNRKNLTLRSLASIYSQQLPAGCTLDACVVDDGSTDGTDEAVKAHFPGATVLKGDGGLFWAGGMRFGWRHYVKKQQFDYLLAYNDDILLYPGALTCFLEIARGLKQNGEELFAVSGALKNPENGRTSYGGLVRSSRWDPLRFKMIEPAGEPRLCDAINMNAVLISAAALESVGFLSDKFVHNGADFEFGIRLKASGGRLLLTPGYIGECDYNAFSCSKEPGISFKERWKRLTGIKEQPPLQRAAYYKRHGNCLWFILWTTPYFRALFESFFLPGGRKRK